MASPLRTKRFYRFGCFRLDPDARVLLRNGDVVPLPPKAVDTLLVLLKSAGQPVEREALIHAVWPDTFVEENNLAHHVWVLRKTLGNGESGRAYIETIPKRGYRFLGEVKEAVEDGGTAEPDPAAPFASPTRSRLTRRRLTVAISLAAAGALVSLWALSRRGPATPLFESLAVLPFQNLSGDPNQNYVSDGLTEALISELARMRSLRVISRTSTMRYKESRKAIPQVARELNVGAVIEGSVARFGDRARVTVQLLDGANDKHLWVETYERDLAEIPKLWGEVAIAVAREIRARVEPEQRARLASLPVKRAAFEAYLRGRYYWNKRTPENIRKAIEFFRKAIDEEPAYARAYCGLADSYNQLGTVLIGGQPPTEIRPLAMAAARKALEIDPELAEAHAALAYAKLYDWEWAAAEEGFQRATRLNPSYASAHLWYSHYLSMRKRPDEALREVKLAHQLDPLSPIIQTQIGWTLQHAGRYDEAIQELRKVLETDPDYLWALWRIGSCYASKGMFQEGIDALEKAATLSGRSPSILGTLAETYGLAGRKGEARTLLNELAALSRQRYVPAIAFAHAYAGLGDSERVFEWLEKAYQQREQGIAYLAVWKEHGPFRSDPRFDALIRRVGLPDK
ncbi:MAG: winged helix-turn-helix domain-containing protein [Acidobacteria bacterium]|nr:winged helix-turn-helix domain-containing protein [Acidobacteriota bacterium]